MTEAKVVKDETKERVLLVIVDEKIKNDPWSVDDVQYEMTELVKACGGEVVESMVCHLRTPTAKYFITEGKVTDIIDYCTIKEVDTVIFTHDLKGSQQRNLEDRIKVKIIDRTQLILDIFAKHATSKEGKMQVELAQLEYLLPRLVGKGVELSRLGGGIGTLGPGETKLEADRRRIAQRITKLKRSINDVVANRQLKRKRRKDRGVATICLVGYTNAGKSSLLNALTQSSQITKDGLFTTLDSLSRQLTLSNHQKVVISDTVGFMHALPHRLIEAFKATLEEVKQADYLLHVLDVSHANFRNLYDSVCDVLKDLEAFDKPTIVVLNKIDKWDNDSGLESIKKNFDDCVLISALKGTNIDQLLDKILGLLTEQFVDIHVDIPINRMDLVNLAHKEGEVYSIKYYNDKINIRASIPALMANRFYM